MWHATLLKRLNVIPLAQQEATCGMPRRCMQQVSKYWRWGFNVPQDLVCCLELNPFPSVTDTHLCCYVASVGSRLYDSDIQQTSCIKYFMLKDRQVVYIMLLYCLNGIPALQQWHSKNVESCVNYSLLKDRQVVCNMLLCCLSGIPALQQWHSTNVESCVNYSLLNR